MWSQKNTTHLSMFQPSLFDQFKIERTFSGIFLLMKVRFYCSIHRRGSRRGVMANVLE